MARHSSAPVHRQRQAERKKRYDAKQQLRLRAHRNLPWALGALVLLNLLFLYGAGLLAYRGNRSAENLSVGTGQVQQATYSVGGGRSEPLKLQLRLKNSPYLLESYLGSNNAAAARQSAAALVQQLRAATTVTAYFDPADFQPTVYQLEADGRVLIELQKETSANWVGSAMFLLMLAVADFIVFKYYRKYSVKK